MHREGGGILIMWDNKVFKSASSMDERGYVLVEGEYLCGASGSQVKVAIMNIYAPCSNREKVLLWKDIENILANVLCSTKCVIGDFNSVRDVSERKGIGNGMVNNSDIARFREFIEQCALKDIPVVGRKYTWYRPNGTARSRLDRALVSDEWLVHWPGSKQYVLSRVVSDHCAVIVKNSISDWGPKPFRTFDVWHHSVGFKEVVRKAWEVPFPCSNSLEGVKEKLKRLKMDIKHWNTEVACVTRNSKRQLLGELEELD